MSSECGPRVYLLLDSPPHVVVSELEFYASLADLDQTVFAVPDLRPAVAGQHIAVGIVGRLLGIDGGILVQSIGGIVIRRPRNGSGANGRTTH